MQLYRNFSYVTPGSLREINYDKQFNPMVANGCFYDVTNSISFAIEVCVRRVSVVSIRLS